MENEQILNAYAPDPGGVISFIDERNVSFRPKEKGRPTVLVLACIEVAGHNRHSPAARSGARDFRRRCSEMLLAIPQ